MELLLTAYMQQNGSNGYIAWIETPKKMKMIVQADTQEKVFAELIISLKVSLSYQLGVNIDSIKDSSELTDNSLYSSVFPELSTVGRKDFKFSLA